MKATLLTLSLLATTQVFSAYDFSLLKPTDTGLSQASVELVDTVEVCPQRPGAISCLAFGSNVTLKIKLNGCADRLGAHFTHFEEVDGKGILMVSAVNIHTKDSERIRCFARPFKMIKVYIPFEGAVELKQMRFQGEIKPMH